MILTGTSLIFENIAGGATEVAKYKTYNTGGGLNYLGLYGANSLLLGSQSASQFVAFSVIIFFPYYKKVQKIKYQKYWFLLSCLLYPMVATMTANLIIIIALLLILLVFREYIESKAKIFLFCICMPLLLVYEVIIELSSIG